MTNISHRILEHEGHILTFDLDVSENSNYTKILCHQRHFKDGSFSVSSATEAKSLVIPQPNLVIVDCRVVVDHQTNRKTPYVLLADSKSKKFSFFLVRAEKKELVLCFKSSSTHTDIHELFLKQYSSPSQDVFKCEMCQTGQRSSRVGIQMKNDKFYSVSAQILNGPNICVSTQDGIYFSVSSSDMGHRKLKQLRFAQESNHSQIKSISLIDMSLQEECTYIMLTLDLKMYQDVLDRRTVVAFQINQSCAILENLDAKAILPPVYVEIMTCMKVLSLQSSANKSLNHQSSILPHIQSRILICTTESQLLNIKDGQITDCVWLPFSDTKSIHTFESASSSSYIAVLSTESNCCIIDSTKFCVEVIVECVHSIHVGDFMYNGAQQLLLLSSKSHDLEHFILTDLDSIHYDTINPSPDNKTQDSCSTSSLTSAVAALETRLQAGLSMLEERRHQSHAQAAMIHKACQDLQNMCLGENDVENSDQMQNFLVPLVGPCTEQYPQRTMKKKTVGLQVSKPWIRVVAGKCVVGVQVFNGTNSKLENPELHMMCSGHYQVLQPKSCCLRYFYKTSKAPKHQSVSPNQDDRDPKTKKRKLDKTEHECNPQVLVITDVDSLKSGETGYMLAYVDKKTMVNRTETWSLLLLWQQNSDQGKGWKSESMVQSCGEVDVNIGDLCSSVDHLAMLESSELETLLSLQCLQSTMTMSLESRMTPVLPALLPVLTDCLGFKYHSILDCYMATGAMTMLRLHIIDSSVNRITLLCHFLEHQHVVLLTHQLYDHLPQDVPIKAVTNQDVRHKQLMASTTAMCDEVSYWSRSMKGILSQSAPSRDDAKASGSVRVDFERSQKRLSDAQKQVCDKEKINDMAAHKAILEHKTDEQILNLGSLTQNM